MTHETVTLRLPKKLLDEAQALALARGVTVGELIRQFLADETDTDVPSGPQNRRVRLSRHLVPVFAAATGWQNLTDSLRARGYTLRPQGAGLAIYKVKDGKHLCNTATVGHRYRSLVKRFGGPMPGHPHGQNWISSENVAKMQPGLAMPGR